MTTSQVLSQGKNWPCLLSFMYLVSHVKEKWQGGGCMGYQGIWTPQLTPAVEDSCSFRCSGICCFFFI